MTFHALATIPRRGLGLALMCSVTSGCSASPHSSTPAPHEDWFSDTGFLERATWASAELHLSGEEIGASSRLTDLLRHHEGIQIRRLSREGWGVIQHDPSGTDLCEVHFSLNGNRLVRSLAGPRFTIDDLVPSRTIDGLEYHVGPDGPTFEADGCGRVLIWSADLRRRYERPFRGSILGQVRSSRPDTVIQVELLPSRRSYTPNPAGDFAFLGLLPGEYRVTYLSPSGQITEQLVRVFAFRESMLELDIRSR